MKPSRNLVLRTVPVGPELDDDLFNHHRRSTGAFGSSEMNVEDRLAAESP